MRKIDESKITSDKSMFFKQGTWTHLQKAYQEPIAESLKAMIGSGYDATKMYVLNGCINSGSGSSFVISAGSVFYGGEVYLVDAVSFSTTGSNVAVATITTTNNTTDYSADPCEFSDGSLENVHNIRKVVIASGASGSGTKNYSAFDFYPFKNNYIDVSSSVTAGAGFTVDEKEVRIYFDGTVQVFCRLSYSGTVSASTNILTGLPASNASYVIVDAYLIDGVSAHTFNHIIQITTALTNPAALSNTYTSINFNYFYKIV